MFGPVQIHRRGEGLKELFSCRCSHTAYREEENNPVSAKKGSLNKFTSKMAAWSETFTELTGKNGPCQDCLCLRVQALPAALWSSGRAGAPLQGWVGLGSQLLGSAAFRGTRAHLQMN